MANAVAFVFKLQDQASGPAKTAASALAEVERQLKAVDRAAKLEALGKATDPLKKAKLGLQVQKDALKDQLGGTGRGAGASLLGMGAMMGAVGGIAGAVAGKFIELGAAAVSGFGSAAAAAANYASEIATFKENTFFAMKNLTGSESAALGLMQRAQGLAGRIGGSTVEVTSSLLTLRQRGFAEKQAEDVIAAMSDLKATNRKANVQGIVEQIAQIQSLGRVTYEDLKPILQQGAPGKEIMAELQKVTHTKTAAEAQKAISAGKVSADEGINAILRAIQTKGGGGALGSVAKAFESSTVEGSIGRVKHAVENLFFAINSSPVGKQLARIFTAFADAIGPSTTFGKAFLGVVNEIAAGLGSMLGGIDSNTITSMFQGIGEAIKTVWPYLKAFGGGLWDGIKAAAGPLLSMVGSMNAAQGPSAELVAAFRSIGEAAGYIIVGLTAVSGVVAAVSGTIAMAPAILGGAVAAMVAYVADGVSSMYDAGANLVTGLWDGLVSGWATLISNVEGLAAQLPAAVRAVLGIHSPSTVFAEIGGYTAEGFAQGVNDNAPVAQGAMLSMVDPRATAAARGAGATTSVATGGNTIMVNVAVGGGKDPEATAQATARAVSFELQRLLDAVAVEAGAIGAPEGAPALDG